MNSELKPLSKKHQRVLDEYLLCFNQWRAYKVVYPSITDESARTLSSKLFADVNFSAHLIERLNEAHMSADEALKLQSDIARGDIGDLIDNNGLLDLRTARDNGLTRLIRKIKQKTVLKLGKKEDDPDLEITEIEFELYSAQEAIRDVLKVHGKFTDRVDVTSGGEKLEIVIRKASDATGNQDK